MNIIRELRKKKGVQQKELSIAIGVSQPTVSDWEKNKNDPSGENLKKLSEFFGVDELVIMGRGVIDLTQDTSTQDLLTKSVEDFPKTIELNTARRWMGHKDAKMILKVYDSVSDDRSENERKKVENRLIQVQNEVQNDFRDAGTVEK